MGHININSIRNKFNMLTIMINGNTDIFMLLETKVDSSFTNAQFVIEGYAPPFRFDRNCHGGRILLFITEDIPAKMLSATCTNDFKEFFVELNFLEKFLLCCFYNFHKSNISSHLISLGETFNIQMTKYDNFLTVEDFNSYLSEFAMSTFCETYHLQNLVKSPTCFKNPEKPSCIDLILTNCPKSSMNTQTVETGLSDFQKLTLTVLKIHYAKPSTKIAAYRDYKNFSDENFRSDFHNETGRFFSFLLLILTLSF